jgi:hypothetical protein
MDGWVSLADTSGLLSRTAARLRRFESFTVRHLWKVPPGRLATGLENQGVVMSHESSTLSPSAISRAVLGAR